MSFESIQPSAPLGNHEAKSSLNCEKTGPWIYINGHPGVGKLTVALELQKLIPTSRVIHNHLIIDLCRSVFEQGSPEYESLRMEIRTTVLNSLTSSALAFRTPYIFTGSHMSVSCNPTGVGPIIARQHAHHAISHGVPFTYVNLVCEEAEHLKRATSHERKGDNGRAGKLTDVGKIQEIRATKLFTFRESEPNASGKSDGPGKDEESKDESALMGQVNEIQLDVTKLSAVEAATVILASVRTRLDDEAEGAAGEDDTNDKAFNRKLDSEG